LIALNEDSPENSCRPAVDVLFRSVGSVYENNILAVIMTGMGSDGAKGVQALKTRERSCYCLTQSQDSCVVYGMPRAVDEAGLSDESIPLDKLAKYITTLAYNAWRRP
jgi:two-component system chemotaxis response regulator CheB